MTAPGANLEFMASAYFRARAESAQGLLAAIKQMLRADPQAGIAIASGIRELELTLGGQGFVVLFARKGNAIKLMHVYGAEEKAGLAIKLQELAFLYGKGKRR